VSYYEAIGVEMAAGHAAALLQGMRSAFRLPRRMPEEPLHPDTRRRAGINYLCAGYKAFFNHIDRPMRMMADLLRQGRFADEAMQLLFSNEGRH
jgi:hypothetical protein